MVTQEELEKMSPEEIAELQRQNCIFCKIIKGDVPSQQVFSNETTHAILDIRPGKAGQVLVMPKEHVPILPLLPPNQFKALFRDVKKISSAVKEGMKSSHATVFVANGPAAGQQASHFLLHVFARDKGDVLEQNFSLPQGNFSDVQNQLIAPLRQNLPLMLANHFKRIGGAPFPLAPPPTTDSQEQKLQPSEDQQDKIAAFFEMYPQAQALLAEDKNKFLELLEKVQPEIKELFAGIDLDVLANQLRKISTESSVSEEIPTPEPAPVVEKEDLGFSAADVFQGNDPSKQAQIVVNYFMSKPKAKELFVQDLDGFKALLATREDIQPIFEHIDIDKLAQVLEQLLSGVQTHE